LLDGLLTSSDPSAGVANSQVTVRQDFFGPTLFITNTNGAIQEAFSTNNIAVENGMVRLGIRMEASTDLSFVGEGVSEGAATADFSNTLNFSQVAGFDVNGNPVDLISAQSSSGFQFSTVRVQSGPSSPVPAPAVLPLFLLGGLAGFVRFRRTVRDRRSW